MRIRIGNQHKKSFFGRRGRVVLLCCRPRTRCCASRTSSTRGGGAAGFSRCVVFSQTEPRELNQWRVSISIYKPMAGVYLLLEYPNIFGIIDKERTRCSVSTPMMERWGLIPCISYAYPLCILRSGSDQVPMRFRWSPYEVPMEIGGK